MKRCPPHRDGPGLSRSSVVGTIVSWPAVGMTVKFAISYNTAYSGVDPDKIVAFARHAEDCGFEALYVQERDPGRHADHHATIRDSQRSTAKRKIAGDSVKVSQHVVPNATTSGSRQ
jgi:hypothetical protein